MTKYFFFAFGIILLTACNTKMSKPMTTDAPERVVVIGQSALEFMIGFKLDDRIVGVAQIDTRNEEFEQKLKELPIITRQWPSKEAILALNPDLIYAMESAFRAERLGTTEFWESRGIRTCLINDFSVDKNLNDYRADLTKSGILFQKEKEVTAFLKGLDDVTNTLEERKVDTSTSEVASRVLFLACVGSAYYYYPPTLCVLDEVVAACGGEYINLGALGIILSTEAIVQANPDKIIISHYQYSDASLVKKRLMENIHFRSMKAIQNKEVLMVDYTNAVSGSLRLAELYQTVFTFIHPRQKEK